MLPTVLMCRSRQLCCIVMENAEVLCDFSCYRCCHGCREPRCDAGIIAMARLKSCRGAVLWGRSGFSGAGRARVIVPLRLC